MTSIDSPAARDALDQSAARGGVLQGRMPAEQELNHQHAGQKAPAKIHGHPQQPIGAPLLGEQTLEQDAVV